MTDSPPISDRNDRSAFWPAKIRAIAAWLDEPGTREAEDELESLNGHLTALRANVLPPEQRQSLLGRLYLRSVPVLETQIPALKDIALPIPRKTRQMIRNLQDLLSTLAEELTNTLSPSDDEPIHTPDKPELALWRSLHLLAQHLLISHLASAPAGKGIWRQFHRTFDLARHLDLAATTPETGAGSLQNVYYAAVLLGCAQPGSFSAREVSFIADYLAAFSDQVDALDGAPANASPAFWVDPARDMPAFAYARKVPPPETPVHYFSCARLVSRLNKQLFALESGDSPKQAGVPELAGTPAGRGVLRRLAGYWGSPGKRRFPRRRQNYRAALCTGLNNLHGLFGGQGESPLDTSHWMITNESPDGYSLMHVSGKTSAMAVGDVAAMRTETGETWQVCIIRWAQSENQEHLELGLQVLATSAQSARLALPSWGRSANPVPVIVLPEIPHLRPSEMLIAATGVLLDRTAPFVLVVEKDNLLIREMRSTQLAEQNSQIEMFLIEADSAIA